MALKLGATDIPDGAGIKVGGTQADKIYLGANVVWENLTFDGIWEEKSVLSEVGVFGVFAGLIGVGDNTIKIRSKSAFLDVTSPPVPIDANGLFVPGTYESGDGLAALIVTANGFSVGSTFYGFSPEILFDKEVGWENKQVTDTSDVFFLIGEGFSLRVGYGIANPPSEPIFIS